jgi:hypothetical protein
MRDSCGRVCISGFTICGLLPPLPSSSKELIKINLQNMFLEETKIIGVNISPPPPTPVYLKSA